MNTFKVPVLGFAAYSADPQLDELINDLDLDIIELVLVEGFRHVPYPKIDCIDHLQVKN